MYLHYLLTRRNAQMSTGKGAQAAKTEIEKLIVKHGAAGFDSRVAVNELARM